MLKRLFFTQLWALLILILSSIPGNDLPNFSWMALISYDKFAHIFFYIILVFLFISEFSGSAKRFATINNIYLFAFLIATFYGGLIELMQENLFVNRTADLYDFISNMVGSAMGVLLYMNKERLTAIARKVFRNTKD